MGPRDGPSSSEMYLGKLQGRAVALDTCNIGMLVTRNLCTKIEEVAEDKGI